MIEMPITLEPYESYSNRLIEETHKMVREMHDIVHCKDCKYKVETEDGEWNPEDIVCAYWASDGLEADDFCSKGEKR